MRQDKLLELRHAQFRRNRLPSMAYRHSRIRKPSTLTGPTAPIPQASPEAPCRQIRLRGRTRKHLRENRACMAGVRTITSGGSCIHWFPLRFGRPPELPKLHQPAISDGRWIPITQLTVHGCCIRQCLVGSRCERASPERRAAPIPPPRTQARGIFIGQSKSCKKIVEVLYQCDTEACSLKHQ